MRATAKDPLDDPDDFSIIGAVISLAKAFSCEVIAEGVETTERGLILLAMGCKQAQGDGIAKPMPANNFDMWLKDYQPNQQWLNESVDQPDSCISKTKTFALTSKQWSTKFEVAIKSTGDASAN